MGKAEKVEATKVVQFKRIGASFHGQIRENGQVIWQGPRRPSPRMAIADANAQIRVAS